VSLARDVHGALGDVATDAEFAHTPTHAAVHADSAAAVATVRPLCFITAAVLRSCGQALVSHAEAAVDEMEWALAALRTIAAAATSGTTPLHERNFDRAECWAEGDEAAEGGDRVVVEDGLFGRAHVLVSVLAELARACLVGPPAEAVLRLLARAYRLLATATRHVRHGLSVCRGLY
jgi:hypothetical protein